MCISKEAMDKICSNCGAKISKGREVWLELDQDNNKFYSNGIPGGHNSQGCFSFGKDCAKKVRSD